MFSWAFYQCQVEEAGAVDVSSEEVYGEINS